MEGSSTGTDDGTETDTSADTGTDTGPGPACGDGQIDDGEQCDDGELNGEYGACALDCDGEGPHCGDGVTNGPETCDDGDDDGLDGCGNTCAAASCGDDVATPGDLCFHPFVEHALTDDPGPMRAVDMDGDDHLDLVVGDVLGGTVLVAKGDGTGNLAASTPVTGPELVHDLVVTDFDGDTNLDVLAVGRTAGYVVLLGDGLGGLTSVATSNEALQSASAVDTNGDDHADLVLGVDGETFVRLGAGDGTFAPQTKLDHPGWVSDWVIPADLDQDQVADLVLALDEADSLEPTGELRTWLGSGGGAFAPSQTFVLADDADRLLAPRVDDDGLPDLVALRGGQPCAGANKKCGGVNWLHPTLGEVTTYVSDGQQPGALGEASSVVVGFDPSDIAAADLDADGKLDLVVAHFAFGWLELLRGDGTGHFALETVDAVGFRHVDVELPDLDEDGIPDIVISRAALGEDPGAVRIRLSNP